MNTEELVGLTRWVEEQIVHRGILTAYVELASLLQNTANGSPQPFEEVKDKLITELEQVNLSLLSNDQRSFLAKLEVLEHLSSSGVTELQNILYKNALDVSTAAKRVGEIVAHIQGAVERSKQIQASLSNLVDIYENPPDEILVRVAFDGAASIGDIIDFKKWATTWFDIGRGVAIAVGETPKDIRVVGAQKGSLILVLATTYAIAQVIAKILLKSLEVAEKVLALRKQLLEIEALKLSNDDLVKQMKKTAEEERRLGLDKISEDLSGYIRASNGEKVTALQKSVSKLLDFIEKGGQVDVVLPIDVEELEENADPKLAENQGALNLRKDVYRIRELEEQVRQIPHLPRED